ncbi:unnamed protein product [Calicophoron daubneyi]|uniref:Major facilitator superfamily (MFS) profile domain-containing protein n=1 Tax=Calicophoron daubneyi TaxID=300641 RepID=A0AAV2TB98_CALDB
MPLNKPTSTSENTDDEVYSTTPSEEGNTVNVDQLLEKYVGPCGLWQWGVALLLMFSMSALTTFPVYANSASPHRCRMDDLVEDFVRTYNITFDQLAPLIGPWDEDKGGQASVPKKDYGCFRYRYNWSKSILNEVLLKAVKHEEIFSSPLERCPRGYVFQPSPYYYPHGVVPEFETLCEWQWLVPTGTSVYMFGMMLGFVFGGMLGDKLGRKKTILLFAGVELVSGIWTCLSPNYVSYIIARAFMGMGNTAKVTAGNVLCVELTVARYRSVLHAVLTIGLNFVYRGLTALWAYLIPQWRLLHVVVMCPNFLSVLYFFLLPESPRWLISQNRSDEALKVLRVGCQVNNFWKGKEKTEELREHITHSFRLEPLLTPVGKDKRRGRFQLFKLCANRQISKSVVFGVLLLIGIVMCYFGLLLYARIVYGYVYLVAFLNSLTAVPATLLSMLTYRYVRHRKRPIFVLLGVGMLVLLGTSLFIILTKPKTDTLLTVSSNIVLILANASLNMCYIYVPELFPSEIRTHAFGFILGLARIGSILCTFVNELDTIVAHSAPLLVYAGAFLLSLFALTFSKDTTGENLADMASD